MRTSLFTAVLATIMSGTCAMAQTTFNEVQYSPEKTVFTLNAPSKAKVSVKLYNDNTGKATRSVKLKLVGTDRWQTTVKGDLKGKYYTFDVSGKNSPGVFAKAVGVNGKRGAIIDMSETNPEGWEDDKIEPLKAADWVIYEMHHRDFSADASSGVGDGLGGKFLALTSPGAIGHLKALGINAVHILPSFDYASVDESAPEKPQYNWGYDPLNYNVPEGSYSTDATDPKCRIREFKEMVAALHKAGIRVILDVVYNHTFDIDNSNFEKTYPGYYYRYKADGTPSDGSGCGNETASDKPLMREFMVESTKYWMEEYHIDGFRFDLMGIHDIETMNLIRSTISSINPDALIYGEGWSAGSCAYDSDKLAMKANVKQMPGIAAFSDDMRDALRGPFSDDTKGAFLAGLAGEEESIKAGIAGMIAHPQVDYTKVNYSKEPWANEPTQMIGYVSCHDDMCLVDRLRASISGIGDDELMRLDGLAQTAVFTSQGIPFMFCGEEVMRDKKGVHNSYCSPDSINKIDWRHEQKYAPLYNYYCNLTKLRRDHKVFRLGCADEVRKRLEFLPTQPCLVGFTIDGKGLDGETWESVIVLLNGSREAKTVEIPDGVYTVVCSSGVINCDGLGTVSGTEVTVQPQSALIIHN